jgi:cell surface protein SprA
MAAILSVDSNLADFATISATGKKSTIGFGALEQGPNQSREDIQQYNIVTNVNLGKLLPPKWGINFPFITPLAKKRLLRIRFNQDIKLKQLLDNTDDSAKRRQYFSRAIDYTKRMSINFIGVRKQRGPEQNNRSTIQKTLLFSVLQ